MRRAASQPPEELGLSRDGVLLLVATTDGLARARFSDLPRFLAAGDLLVVNTSSTLAAAVDGHRPDGRPVAVHLSTPLDDGTWLVELREQSGSLGRVTDAGPGDTISLPGGASGTLLYRYPDPRATRLWASSIVVPGAGDAARSDSARLDSACLDSARGDSAHGDSARSDPARGDSAAVADKVTAYLARHGRPIRYSYVPVSWPLSAYQTVFARDDGSAEMPSAGRPFTPDLVISLIGAGVVLAPITLHAGVASLETGEPPLPERFNVPEPTAQLVNLTLAASRRVVAVGTTVTRALESAADSSGAVRASSGWTDLVLGADRPARVVSGLITGWHDPEASHLALLEAVAGPDLVRAAYAEAEQAGYLWHEFGDSCLLLPPVPSPRSTDVGRAMPIG